MGNDINAEKAVKHKKLENNVLECKEDTETIGYMVKIIFPDGKTCWMHHSMLRDAIEKFEREEFSDLPQTA